MKMRDKKEDVKYNVDICNSDFMEYLDFRKEGTPVWSYFSDIMVNPLCKWRIAIEAHGANIPEKKVIETYLI